MVCTVLRGLRRTVPYVPRRKKPLVAEDLGRILGVLTPSFSDQRDRAMLLLGFAGAFRRSELVSIRVSDVHFVGEGARVWLARSKTDQQGVGMWKAIPRSTDPDVCPVRAVAAWLDLAFLEGSDPLFPALDWNGRTIAKPFRALDPQGVELVIKVRTAQAGLEGDYSGHSLRAGFVTEAARQDRRLDAIMRQTGHKSVEQVMTYIRPETLFDDAAGEGLLDPAAKAFRTNPTDGKPLVKFDREALRREREAREAAQAKEIADREAAERAKEHAKSAAGQAQKLSARGYTPAQIARILGEAISLTLSEVDVRRWLRETP